MKSGQEAFSESLRDALMGEPSASFPVSNMPEALIEKEANPSPSG